MMKPLAAASPPKAMQGSSATATPAATGSASSSILACTCSAAGPPRGQGGAQHSVL